MAYVHIATTKGHTIEDFRTVTAKHNPPRDIDGLLAWAAGSDQDGLRAQLAASAGPDSPLSPRELEVAALVARGLTNKQIGETLFVSERTAENHVQHILVKLGFSNRSQIAAWARE